MAYQALYRKWRPSTFSEIVGQEQITATLRNEIKSGKIAQAYLFCGSRGTGKTTTARVFSKAVNCLHPIDGNPCNECSVCRGIADGSLMDIVEIDAASNNGVDNIRTINSEVSYLPSGVTYKIYIIDEVHMLSGSAFNALLKTLEEPPSHVIFILATTESHKIPATILSRCQRFDFRRISQSPMLDRLKKVAEQDGISITEDALSLIIKSADGSMRDALSLLDQCSSGHSGEIDADWVRAMTGGPDSARMLSLGNAILEYQVETVFLQVKQAIERGFDPVRLLEGLLEYFRNLLLCKSSDSPARLLDLAGDEVAALSVQAEHTSLARCLSAMETLSKAYDATRWAKNSRLVLEMALIQISHPKAEKTNLAARVERLEAMLQEGGIPPSPATRPTANEIIKTAPSAPKIPSPQPAPIPAQIPEPEKPLAPPNEPKPEPKAKQEPEVKPDEPVEAEDISEGKKAERIIACWPEILREIEQAGNPLLSGALKSGEFRVKHGTLYLLDQLPMMITPQNTQQVQKAVKEICGCSIRVHFTEFGREPEIDAVADETATPAPPHKSDRLEELAKQLEQKINIIS